jgi:hypothetical protein
LRRQACRKLDERAPRGRGGGIDPAPGVGGEVHSAASSFETTRRPVDVDVHAEVAAEPCIVTLAEQRGGGT